MFCNHKIHKMWSFDSQKIIKIDVTRYQILRLKCSQSFITWGSTPAVGVYSAPPDPSWILRAYV